MIYIGIDPGKKGGIAIIDTTQKDISTLPYSDDTLKSTMRMYSPKNTLCFLEKVGAMPKQGVTSMFNFGQSFGYIRGVLEANEIPYELVSPQKWKKHFGIGNDKSKAIETAQRLFPKINLLPTPRCLKESDGMAEALLIAVYCKRVSQGRTVKFNE